MSGKKRGPVTTWDDVVELTKDVEFDPKATLSLDPDMMIRDVPAPSFPTESGTMISPSSFFNYSFAKKDIAVVGDEYFDPGTNNNVPSMKIMMIRGKDPNGTLQYAPTLKFVTPIGPTMYARDNKAVTWGNLAIKDGHLWNDDTVPVAMAKSLSSAKTQNDIRLDPNDPARGKDHALFIEFVHALKWMVTVHLFRDTAMHSMTSERQSVAAFFKTILDDMKNQPQFEKVRKSLTTKTMVEHKSYVLRAIYRKLSSGVKFRRDDNKEIMLDTAHISSTCSLLKKMYERRGQMPPRAELPSSAPPEVVDEYARNPQKTYHVPTYYTMTGGNKSIPLEKRFLNRGDNIALGVVAGFTAGNPKGEFVGIKFDTEMVFFHSRNPNPNQGQEEMMVAVAADAEDMDTSLPHGSNAGDKRKSLEEAGNADDKAAAADDAEQANEPAAQKPRTDPDVVAGGVVPNDSDY